MTRSEKEKVIEKWMKHMGLLMDDLGCATAPVFLNELDDDQINSIIEDVEEDRARDKHKGLEPNY